jgi:UDP-N-acetylglucosamine--N-acetylmuramyl-(pentapeptide) pyrophosphoryl-undecaprenol N-acetylglucosamine transferase
VTVAELSAVGLPGVFVPLPIGNGEQGLNAAPAVAAGAGLLVHDGDLTAEVVRHTVLPLLQDRTRLAEMSSAARGLGRRDADETLAGMVLEVAA